jgi:hypothetical protein
MAVCPNYFCLDFEGEDTAKLLWNYSMILGLLE